MQASLGLPARDCEEAMLTISVFIFVPVRNVHHLDAILAPIGYL